MDDHTRQRVSPVANWAGRWSLVAGRWSLVAGRWSLVFIYIISFIFK
jgi:hypothetical protein